MPPKSKPSAALEQLKQLAGAAQVACAIEIVADEKDVRALRAALDVLRANPTDAARPALLARYAVLAADGVKRDAGTYLRAAILQTLRPLARPADAALLAQAAETYEYLPPTRSEEASLLRSTALVVLNEVDSSLAAFHALRLLNDPETSRLSGEPALTAARLLAAHDNRAALYAFVLYQARLSPPATAEVVSECLKSLEGMPAALLPGVLGHYQDSADETVLVGLVDLALAYGDEPAARAVLLRLLGSTRQYAVYRYLVARLVTDHDARYLPELARLAGAETDPRRRGILEEVLPLGGADPHARAALAALKGAGQKSKGTRA